MEPSNNQEISVSEVLDDDGHPFLIFSYTEGEGSRDYEYDMIAKKQKDDFDIMNPEDWEGLTEDERDRLGIDLTYSEVEQTTTQETTEDVEENK